MFTPSFRNNDQYDSGRHVMHDYAIYHGDVINVYDQILLITDASIVVLTLFVREVVFQNTFTESQTTSEIPQKS